MNLLFAAENLELEIGAISLRVVGVASAIILALIIYAALTKKRSSIVFGGIVAVTTAATLFLIGSTIYLNTVSITNGPVHWHADFEIYKCGQKLELADPQGALSNKIGTPTLHEHNDGKVHLEGVLLEKDGASLGNFFSVIGGEVNSKSMVVPTNSGKVKLIDGQPCDGQPAEFQAFLYRTAEDGQHYTQTKLDNPATHVIKDESQVPPGDCVIFELAPPKNSTDKMCLSWEVAKDLDKIKEGPR